MSIDLSIFQAIHGLANHSKFIDGLGIFLANYFGYLLIIVAVYLLFKKEKEIRRRIFVFLFFILTAILSRGLVTEIIRFFYHRLRPFNVLNFSPLIKEGAFSFPSGHMTFYFALAMTIFLLNKKWAWIFVGGVVLMGIARIFVGVHWPSDILAGILIAIASYFIVKKILPYKKTAQ